LINRGFTAQEAKTLSLSVTAARRLLRLLIPHHSDRIGGHG
jgi:hypothetical protein